MIGIYSGIRFAKYNDIKHIATLIYSSLIYKGLIEVFIPKYSAYPEKYLPLFKIVYMSII